MNKIKNQNGATIILITLLTLTVLMAISFSLSDIVLTGIKLSRVQSDSTKAFYATEAGAERVLKMIRKDSIDLSTCDNVNWKYIDYNNSPPPNNDCENNLNQATVNLASDAEYYTEYDKTGDTTSLKTSGKYSDTRRITEISYCSPNCSAATSCADSDGCGGTCPATCISEIGCIAPGYGPANSEATGSDFCCGVDSCLTCSAGFTWNGADCAAD